MKKYTRIRWKRVETNPDNRKKDKYKYILFAGIFELLRVELISRFRALLQLRAKTKGNKRQDTTPTKIMRSRNATPHNTPSRGMNAVVFVLCINENTTHVATIRRPNHEPHVTIIPFDKNGTFVGIVKPNATC